MLYVYLGKKQQSKSCIYCMLHTFLTWYMPLPKIIKVSQTVWELWPAPDFGIRGDKYIIEKVRVLLNTTCLLVLIYASSTYFKPNTPEFVLEFIQER